ncbi:antibiotic biosynthesis monooxygenase [bacterium]|nr:antibiotic biosynthesis monooxygenase [bacterium]
MIVNCVTVHVIKEHITDFIEATTANHEGSVREPGNLRFDVLQSKDDPSCFLLYEVFESAEAVTFHRSTQHYLTWRDTVAGWMAQPRTAVSYTVVCPKERKEW